MLTAETLKTLAMECGADGCGVIGLEAPSLAGELPLYPRGVSAGARCGVDR